LISFLTSQKSICFPDSWQAKSIYNTRSYLHTNFVW